MKDQPEILVVDDDDRLRTAIQKVLTAENHECCAARSGRETIDLLRSQPFAVAVIDLRLPDLEGIDLLKKVRQLRPDLEVIMLTGHGSIGKAVEAMRLGAYDFLEKPVDADALLKTISKALEKQRLTSENRALRKQLEGRRGLEVLIGDSPKIRAVKVLVQQLAPTNVAVLIQGESGTGKEIVADALHELSDRREKPLRKISCAAIPETLLESELFGHERGAFTGASSRKAGKFELADGGTLLLDEIAEMSPLLQAKLLRVLQDGRFQRLGGTYDLLADFRLLAATHSDLPRGIQEKRFRHDLYYRINTVQIALPALRDRLEDVPLLADHFLRRFASAMGKPARSISRCALDQLLSHPWPGNVRELEHVIQRSVALGSDEVITGFAFAPGPESDTAAIESLSRIPVPMFSVPIGTTMDEATKKLVQATISECAGNKSKAADILGIPARTMYRHFPGRDSQSLS